MRTKEGKQERIGGDRRFQDCKVFINAVQGFSLVHDPEGAHYENLAGEVHQNWVR